LNIAQVTIGKDGNRWGKMQKDTKRCKKMGKDRKRYEKIAKDDSYIRECRFSCDVENARVL